MRTYALRLFTCIGSCALVGLLGLAAAQAPFGPTVMGKIIWPEHDLSRAHIRVYADARLSKLVDQFPTGTAGGTFVLLVDPGEYYLMAVVDANANEKLDMGDGIGFFGVTRFGAEDQSPRPIKVSKDAIVSDVMIPITATIGEDGKPAAIPKPAEVGEVKPQRLPAAVGGTISGLDGVAAPVFLLVLGAEDHRPAHVARVTADQPEFQFTVPAGSYHLIAVVDRSGDTKLGPGDLVGAYGVSDWSDPPEALPPLTVNAGDEIGGIEVALTGQMGDDGTISPPNGAGRFQLDLTTMPAVLSGEVRYQGAGLKPAQVRFSTDPGMSQPIASVKCEPGPGTFVCCLRPGTYYLTAVIDEDNDGRFGPGDGIGFYGISDLTATTAPAPVTVGSGALVADLNIEIIARVTEDLKLAPLAASGSQE